MTRPLTPPRLVVGAAITDDPDQPRSALVARRSRPADLAGCWEFPGGKVEPGETPQQALVRELREELDVTVSLGTEVLGPDGGSWPISDSYVLRVWLATLTTGTPTPGDSHDRVRWVPVAELPQLTDWVPADQPIAAAICAHLSTP